MSRELGSRLVLPKLEPVPGAEWQAGVTPDNDEYRVLLNGEPVALAFAASESRGWVMVFGDPEPHCDLAGRVFGHRIPRDRLDVNPATGNGVAYRVLRGFVQVVRGD